VPLALQIDYLESLPSTKKSYIHIFVVVDENLFLEICLTVYNYI